MPARQVSCAEAARAERCGCAASVAFVCVDPLNNIVEVYCIYVYIPWSPLVVDGCGAATSTAPPLVV